MTNTTGLIKSDMLEGTVTRATYSGVYVTSPDIDGEGFCRCILAPGTIAYFEITSFVISANGISMKPALDSVVEYGISA